MLQLKNIERINIIEYILSHNKKIEREYLEKLRIEQLVIIKVQIELGYNNEQEDIKLSDNRQDD